MLTNEQITEKAEELSKIHGCPVHPYVFTNTVTQDQVIGYYKEPPLAVQAKIGDVCASMPISAGMEVLDSYIIKEESDSRLYDKKLENKAYYFGLAVELSDIVKLAINQFKKK